MPPLIFYISTTYSLLFLVTYVQGQSRILQLTVDPYPAIIYENAPQNTPVLQVIGFDNATRDGFESMHKTLNPDSEYFRLTKVGPVRWVMHTKQLIDKPLNYTFQFRVYGTYSGTYRDRDVLIRVTKQNLHAPKFEQNHYTFSAYRYPKRYRTDEIGTVVATDDDKMEYNSIFSYFIMDRSIIRYFRIDPRQGKIMIEGPFPPNVSQFTFNVTAIDSGSPQLMSDTSVTVKITDVPPPDIFCVAVDNDKARICWKDPTNGGYVDSYHVQFTVNGQNTSSHPVLVYGNKSEVCTSIQGRTLFNKSYRFTVKVYNGTDWSPSSVQRLVNITKNGLYGPECPSFSECSIWQPCKFGGSCQTNQDLSYSCNCVKGRAGVNCTEVDRCVTNNPCKNNASCTYLGGGATRCTCPIGFHGGQCQFVDKCTSFPCKNGGSCMPLRGGSFQCTCAPHFTGLHCETNDPCNPNPCENQGLCNNITGIDYICSCPNGYSGHDCDIVNLCVTEPPCKNHGNCTFLGHNDFNCSCGIPFTGKVCNITDLCKINGFCKNSGFCFDNGKCRCQPGYYGNECQHYDKCYEKPCINGKCNRIYAGNFTCKCYPGYSGKLCQNYNFCFSNPCKFGGTCTQSTNSSGNYSCSCIGERFGQNCEYLDGCKLNPCKNGGTCTNTTVHGGVNCGCRQGFTGDRCDKIDHCQSLPCQNGGKCILTENNYTCNCKTGYVGDKCEVKDSCLQSPCQNHGSCETDGSGNHVCKCLANFFGKYCERYQFCSASFNMCLNNATCRLNDLQTWHQVLINNTVANVTNWYNCTCPEKYAGHKCQHTINPCDSIPCGESGTCMTKGDSHLCYCSDGTSGTRCHKEICEEEKTLHKTGGYTWPKTEPGNEAMLQCEYGSRDHSIIPHARRKCEADSKGNAFWTNPDTSGCFELDTTEADKRLRELISFTGNVDNLTPEMVANITTTLEDLFVYSFEDIQIAKEMTVIISNLLKVSESVLVESNSRNHSSERLLELLDDYASGVQTETNTSIETENINILVINYTIPQERLTTSDDDYTSIIYQPAMINNNLPEQAGIVISVPKEAILQGGEQSSRLQFMSFRTSSFFISDEKLSEDIILKQKVISAKIKGANITNLKTPVMYNVSNIMEDKNHTCVYWDTENRRWSSSGITTLSLGGTFTQCQSNHLTSFAILLDPSPGINIPQVHDKVLTYISYIGCIVSMVGLLLTIITYSMFRSLNRERSGKILLNLCVSMLFMNGAFLLMAETNKSEDGELLCMIVAILLHYFLLTSLMWMCTEAVNMYQALVTVFAKYSSYFILKRCIVSWGIPLIIIAATMGVNKLDNYRSSTDFCYISHASELAFYISLMGPACCILVINTVVFTLVARVILKPRFKGYIDKNESITPAQVRGAFTVMVLLGVTWVFGPIAINESKIVFNYLFTILNILQGFLIFVFRCLFNNEVRLAWVLLIKTGKFKRRKGPITSMIESYSSKGESKIHADSTAHTTKSHISHGNGCNKNQNGGSKDHMVNGQRKQNGRMSNGTLDFTKL